MKTYKNKFLAVLVSVFTIVSFTSCENDYFWTAGELVNQNTVNISPNGKIRADIPIGYDWVTFNRGDRYANIEDIKFLGGEIQITPKQYIYNFTLRLSNSNAVLPFSSVSYPDYILDDSPEAQDFLHAVVEVIRRYGYATIYIDGAGAANSRFNIDFYMDLDVYVRD